MPTMDLNRYENLSSAAAIVMGALDLGRRGLTNVMKELTPDQLAAKPDRFGNSIGTLVQHVASAEVLFSHLIMGKPMSEELLAEFPRHPMGQPLPDVPAGTTAAQLLAKLEKSRGIVLDALAGVTDADLSREIAMGPDRTATVRWFMGVLPGHQAQHYGQIQMLARHL